MTLPLALLFMLFALQDPKEATAGDAQKPEQIKRIVVEGTRLPALSIVHLAQIKVGDEVNFLKLHSALQKVTLSGLVKNIDFEYESLPNSETEVIVHLKCTDEKPSTTAAIQIQKVEENEVWAWLTEVDPLFTREMPPTEAAIRLYCTWIGKYMKSHGEPGFQENFAVVADVSSSTGGAAPDRVVFKVVKRRGHN